MVEAAGIEPASEGLQQEVSSMLSLFLRSREKKLEEAKLSLASPGEGFACPARCPPGKLSCYPTPLQASQEEA